MVKALCGRHKIVAERMLARYEPYNEILDEIETLEAEGLAYVFSPNAMLTKNTTLDQKLLQENYRLGYAQAREELSAWRDFL